MGSFKNVNHSRNGAVFLCDIDYERETCDERCHGNPQRNLVLNAWNKVVFETLID